MTPAARRTHRWTKFRLVAREYAEAFGIALILALVIRAFVIQAYKIPSASMRPTLIEGDRILVNKYLYRFREPEPGDIVVFRFPERVRQAFIKRLVGRGGDTVEIRADGRVVVNGQLLREPKVFEGLRYAIPPYRAGPNGRYRVEVPDETYFVLGDNTQQSRDSRDWGFVPKRNMLGKALMIFWPGPPVLGGKPYDGVLICLAHVVGQRRSEACRFGWLD